MLIPENDEHWPGFIPRATVTAQDKDRTRFEELRLQALGAFSPDFNWALHYCTTATHQGRWGQSETVFLTHDVTVYMVTVESRGLIPEIPGKIHRLDVMVDNPFMPTFIYLYFELDEAVMLRLDIVVDTREQPDDLESAARTRQIAEGIRHCYLFGIGGRG